jgi:hypothetical protein
LQQQVDVMRDFMIGVYRKEEELIRKMREVDQYCMGFLKGKSEQLVRQQYLEGRSIRATSAEARELYEKLKILKKSKPAG